MLGLEGIPGIYIHSLIGTPNDLERVENTGQNRSINRRRWDFDELAENLDSPHSHHHKVLTRLSQLIRVRKAQPAFHPNATQFTLRLDDKLFGFWRQSIDRSQSIFCISNVTDKDYELTLSDINLIVTDDWVDLITQLPVCTHTNLLKLAPYQTVWLSNKNEIADIL